MGFTVFARQEKIGFWQESMTEDYTYYNKF